MTDTLDRIIYALNADQPGSNILALSDNLTSEDVAQWQSFVTLDAQPQPSKRASQTLGLFDGPSHNFLLVTAYLDDQQQTIYEVVLVPRRFMQQSAGNLEPLAALVMEPVLDINFAPGSSVAPLEAPVLLPWSFEDRLEHFRALLDDYGQGHIEPVLRLLGAALDERGLLIITTDKNTKARLALVQGLMALLPASYRADLTFSTHVSQADGLKARIGFADQDLQTERWLVHADIPAVLDQSLLETSYVAFLMEQWQADPAAFMQVLADLEPLANKMLSGLSLSEGLDALAEQVQLNERVRRGETVDPDDLKAVMSSELPLPDDLELMYARLLLTHALQSRDTEAAMMVALRMDSSPALDEALGAVLSNTLETQPDAVYVFARTRLTDALELDEKWLERLQAAALVSLHVAINDADGETIINWLRLIAREPDSYGLGRILHEGILAAQARTYEDPDLARQLITLAVKQDPEALDILLADDKLMAALPNNLGAVLRDHAGDSLRVLESRGTETFLIAMARSAQAQASASFTPDVIDQIWKIYTSGEKINLPAYYQPAHVIDLLIDDSATWLSLESREHLLTLMLADGRDELFQQFAARLAEDDLLLPVLSSALHESQRSIDDLITLSTQLVTANQIDQQAVVNTLIDILNKREWRQSALPIVEHLARMVQQNPALDIDAITTWRLLDIAMTGRSDLVARVGAQQILNDIEQEAAQGETGPDDGDADLVDSLVQLYHFLQWSQNTQQYVLRRWRDFIRPQTLVRLARLDKALDGKKSLVDLRAIVQTTLAFRRMLSNRTLEDFASAVNTAYAILADIAESFEPTPRQTTVFDEETIRAELDSHHDQLNDHEWRILAKNFKELASLIGEMGDNRSKGNLVRQNIDRLLQAGDQQPEGAVDAMKWMAGYLDGSQNRSAESEE